MDWLHQVRGAVEKEIFHQVANLLNLEAGHPRHSPLTSSNTNG